MSPGCCTSAWCPPPATPGSRRSGNPGHPCYVEHRDHAEWLAASYLHARRVHEAEVREQPGPPERVGQPDVGAVVVPAGQLSEWVLEDLLDDAADLHR